MQTSNANCKGKIKEQIGMVMRLRESGTLWATLVRYFSWGNQGGRCGGITQATNTAPPLYIEEEPY